MQAEEIAAAGHSELITGTVRSIYPKPVKGNLSHKTHRGRLEVWITTWVMLNSNFEA